MEPTGVHPVADLFPMLAADELAELAADIKARGLLQPVVLDDQGRVLDGRNRLVACELAGVEPRFETFAGEDPDGYALAVNVARRHLLPKQRHLVTEKARRIAGATKSSVGTESAEARLREAAAVLDWAPELAEQIIAGGGPSLNDAAAEARSRKHRALEVKARQARIRAEAPDLAALVDEDRMTLDDAVAALDARQTKAAAEADARDREQRQRTAERREANVKRYEATARAIHHLRFVSDGWLTEFDPADFPHDRDVVDALDRIEQMEAARDGLDRLIAWRKDHGR